MKLLYVEDNKELREMVVNVIETRFPFVKIVEASGVGEAIRATLQHTFDIIICDYNLGDGTGGDFYVWLKATNQPNVEFVLCTSHDKSELAEFNKEPHIREIDKTNIFRSIVAFFKEKKTA